jgi:hypothetical protein
MRRGWTQFALWLIAHTPKVWHPSRKRLHHTIGVFIALCLMLAGPFLEFNAEAGTELVAGMIGITIPHTLWASFAWSVHAFGFIPLVAHADKLWSLLIHDDIASEVTVPQPQHPRKQKKKRRRR